MQQNFQAPTNQRYQFVPRVLVFLSCGDELLLMRRADDRPIFPGLYNGLGGHVERGESVLAAAHRELNEESGLQGIDLWLCAVVAIDTGDADAGIVMWVFRGEATGEATKESGEGTLEWVSKERIAALPLVEDIPYLLPRVLSIRPGDSPLWGFYDYGDEGKLRMNFDGDQ